MRQRSNALLTRKKPRDFYDLYYVLRAGLKIRLPKEKRNAILKETALLDNRSLVNDLKDFLPKSHRLIIKDLPAILKRELKRI